MKKFIFNLTIIISILLLVFFLMNYFQSIYNKSPRIYKIQFQEAINKESETNAIIIGTSHAIHSIRPSILDTTGLNFYNFSINGSNPEYYLNWFNEIFIREHSIPKYCIFSVDWFMFDDVWLWRDFEHDSEYFPFSTFSRMLFQKKFNKKDLIVNRFPVLKYRTKIVESLKLSKGDPRFLIDEFDKGFVPVKSIPYSNIFHRRERQMNYTISEKQVQYFKEIIALLKTLNIKIIFVMTPEFDIDIPEYKTMKSIDIISAVAQENQIPFLNFNTDLRSGLNENSDYFDDWGHMNSYGSLKFSKLLKLEIAKLLQ